MTPGAVPQRSTATPWTLADIYAALAAAGDPAAGDITVIASDAAALDLTTPVGRLRISTAEIEPGDVFVALQGTQSHGAEHWHDARRRGAVAIVIGTDALASVVEEAQAEWPGVFRAAGNGVTTLGWLARAWRRHCDFTVVGVTGSSGKTSTKDILRALLSSRRSVVASHANHNNEIGVPLTLLSATPDTDVVICEMGMRGLGQIDYLCELALPNVGIVTNTGSAHLELLGTEGHIVQAKAELLGAVALGGTAIVPAGQPELLAAANPTPRQVLTFGDADTPADCTVVGTSRTASGIEVQLDAQGERLAVQLPVHGTHQARNLAAAVSAYIAVIGSTAGLAEAVVQVVLTAGRGDRHRLPGGGTLVDDAYNANPESMWVALHELVEMQAPRRVAVLGSMAELGPASVEYHRELGQLVASLGVDVLVVVATTPETHELAAAYAAAASSPAQVYASPEAAAAARGEWLRAGDAVLVKASNSVGLGRLVASLVESGTEAAPTGGAGGAMNDRDSEMNT